MPRTTRFLALSSTLGAALAVAASPAHAASSGSLLDGVQHSVTDAASQSSPRQLPENATGTVTGVTEALRPVAGLRVNPLAHTGVDPLTNGVGTQVADFKPVSSTDVTEPVSGASLGDTPVAGNLLKNPPIGGR